MTREIICYHKNCNNEAIWQIPGRPMIYLCTKHMQELFADKQVVVAPVSQGPPQRAVGPTEFKSLEAENV